MSRRAWLFSAVATLCVFGDARATILRGEVQATTRYISFESVDPLAPVPFGLTPGSSGAPVAIRFWLDTELAPPPDLGHPGDPPSFSYAEYLPMQELDWLRVELEIGGVVEPLRVEGGEFTELDERDAFSLQARDVGDTTQPYPYVPDRDESLALLIQASDFAGRPLPRLDFDVVPDRTLRSEYARIEGADGVRTSLFSVDFAVQSVSLHPVPEPIALALLALAAPASLLRRRRVTR
jgi:hypothetical protein